LFPDTGTLSFTADITGPNPDLNVTLSYPNCLRDTSIANVTSTATVQLQRGGSNIGSSSSWNIQPQEVRNFLVAFPGGAQGTALTLSTQNYGNMGGTNKTRLYPRNFCVGYNTAPGLDLFREGTRLSQSPFFGENVNNIDYDSNQVSGTWEWRLADGTLIASTTVANGDWAEKGVIVACIGKKDSTEYPLRGFTQSASSNPPAQNNDASRPLVSAAFLASLATALAISLFRL
jgi:hypothetical protein